MARCKECGETSLHKMSCKRRRSDGHIRVTSADDASYSGYDSGPSSSYDSGSSSSCSSGSCDAGGF